MCFNVLRVCVSGLQSAAYTALIHYVRHASFRKVLVLPLLSCIVWGQVSGVSLNIHTHMGLHTRSATFSLQRSMDHFNLARHFLLSSSCSLGNRHLVWIISGAQSDVHIVQEVWYASLVQVQSLRLGKEVVAVLVWLMGQHQGLRGSEAQRVDLINNRTYP